MTSPSRNQPCPCGSGKKFKQCHGRPRLDTPPLEERAWRELRRALDGFPAMMQGFVRQVYGRGAVDEAWREFLEWPDGDPRFDAETPFMPLFMPWLFHRWAPDPLDTSVKDPALHDRAPTSVLLERRGHRLDPRLRRYLEACAGAPFSFHEIVACEPGVEFHTRDLFVGTEHEVTERSASRSMKAGDTLFGQIVECDGVSMLEACGPFVVSPLDRIGLIDFRERMKASATGLGPENLREWDPELRGAYLTIADELLRPAPPSMQNTDGEDFELHRLDFEIESAKGAFDALKHLALDETEDELLASAEMDEKGRLRRVSLPWKVAGNRVHAEWDNTVLGQLEIDGARLVVNVNSAERAARILRIVEGALGEGARFVSDEVQSLDDAMLEAAAPEVPDTPDLSEHPEVRKRIDELVRAHYDRWVSEPVPALGGLSPLEAVQRPGGREKVKALVDQIERNGPRMQPPLDPGVVDDLRRRLGLG